VKIDKKVGGGRRNVEEKDSLRNLVSVQAWKTIDWPWPMEPGGRVRISPAAYKVNNRNSMRLGWPQLYTADSKYGWE